MIVQRESYVATYYGREIGQRILDGRLPFGAPERIHAVVWFSDMQDYTRLSERLDDVELVALLNDYADAVITSVHGAGGDVLKLMADGVLAIFTAEDPADACVAALRAEAAMRAKLDDLHGRRRAAGQPVSSIYVGIHIGDVVYGNIGGRQRLDFTVVGHAVNEANRIAGMCRSADREALFSCAFRDVLPQTERGRLVSVGRYALRGVEQPQELFTIDPELLSPLAIPDDLPISPRAPGALQRLPSARA